MRSHVHVVIQWRMPFYFNNIIYIYIRHAPYSHCIEIKMVYNKHDATNVILQTGQSLRTYMNIKWVFLNCMYMTNTLCEVK